LKIDRAKGDY